MAWSAAARTASASARKSKGGGVGGGGMGIKPPKPKVTVPGMYRTPKAGGIKTPKVGGGAKTPKLKGGLNTTTPKLGGIKTPKVGGIKAPKMPKAPSMESSARSALKARTSQRVAGLKKQLAASKTKTAAIKAPKKIAPTGTGHLQGIARAAKARAKIRDAAVKKAGASMPSKGSPGRFKPTPAPAPAAATPAKKLGGVKETHTGAPMGADAKDIHGKSYSGPKTAHDYKRWGQKAAMGRRQESYHQGVSTAGDISGSKRSGTFSKKPPMAKLISRDDGPKPPTAKLISKADHPTKHTFKIRHKESGRTFKATFKGATRAEAHAKMVKSKTLRSRADALIKANPHKQAAAAPYKPSVGSDQWVKGKAKAVGGWLRKKLIGHSRSNHMAWSKQARAAVETAVTANSGVKGMKKGIRKKRYTAAGIAASIKKINGGELHPSYERKLGAHQGRHLTPGEEARLLNAGGYMAFPPSHDDLSWSLLKKGSYVGKAKDSAGILKLFESHRRGTKGEDKSAGKGPVKNSAGRFKPAENMKDSERSVRSQLAGDNKKKDVRDRFRQGITNPNPKKRNRSF